MGKKYYAVRKGREIGIFQNWSECQEQVKGFPSAEYKSFKSLDDAERYLALEEELSIDDNSLKAYVDGSYDSENKIYGSGVVLIYDNQVIDEISSSDNDPDLVEMRNVAGELKAALLAMEYARNNNYDEITIYYDYAGIEYWANDQWKANKKGTQKYKALVKDFRKHINIDFIKVKAHSGDYYNDMADELARRGISDRLAGPSQDKLDHDYHKLFMEELARYEDSSGSIDFDIKGLKVKDLALNSFAKKIWRMNGFLIKNIKDHRINIDFEGSKISFYIKGENEEVVELDLII